MSTLIDLDWPSSEDIIDYQKPVILIQMEKLFYFSSLSITVVYIIVNALISPILQRNYDQRLEIHYEILLRLRRLVNTLKRSIKSTHLTAIGDNQRVVKGSAVYIDRCVQTKEEFVSKKDTKGWEHINSRLNSALQNLKDHNRNISSFGTLESTTFQAKLLSDIFNDTRSTSTSQTISSAINNIREVKGWFVHGKIPS